MHFTLTGELVDSTQTTREKHNACLPSILVDACKGEVASPNQQEVRQSPWEWDGATMIDRDGFPSCQEDMVQLLVHDYEVCIDTCCTVARADFLQGTGGQDAKSQNVQSHGVGPEEEDNSRRREIVGRLLEHIRCVRPVSDESKLTLTLFHWRMTLVETQVGGLLCRV